MPATRPKTEIQEYGGDAFETTNPEATQAFLSATFGIRIRISGHSDNYRYAMRRLQCGSFYLNTVDQRATTDIRADPLPNQLAVIRMYRGIRTNVRAGDRLGAGDIAIHAQPGRSIHCQYASVRYSVVLLPLNDVVDVARNRPDDELGRLHFDSLRPVNPAAGRRWQQSVEYVAGWVRADPDAMTHPLLAGAARRLLAATLLTSFPNTCITEPHHHDRSDATPAALARAIAFIDTNTDLDITVVDIARAAYVTVRAVQLAFRRHLDTTPTAYLRRVRLERAHQQLRTARPDDGTTVGEVAARWGFADPSRFTARYRHTYGQLPSQTLRS